MEFLKPLKWIDEKMQSIVDWVAHTILILFGIKISEQKYVVMTIIIVSMIGDYFLIPEKERSSFLLILKLLVAFRMLLLQRNMKKMDEFCEDEGFILNLRHPKAQQLIYIVRIGIVVLFVMDVCGVWWNFMSTICNTGGLLFSYLILTPFTPPPTKQHQEAFSPSS